MKKYKYILFSLIASGLMMSGCNFLDNDPQGIMGDEDIKQPAMADKAVNSAYASLGNDNMNTPFSLWYFGNVRAGDAYKGGASASDGSDINFYELGISIKPDFYEADGLWAQCYDGISRANIALTALKAVSLDDMPTRDVRIGEMYFIRGYYYFMLKIVFGRIPFVDEDTPLNEYTTIDNKLPNNDQWALIASDFKKAYDNLPDKQDMVGRANKIAASAYLAKTYLYKAYRQDNAGSNILTSINNDDLEEVLTYTNYTLNSGRSLEYDFAYNFLPGTYENGVESLFAVQFSKDDGTMFGRLNFSDVLSVPMGVGCCDFHKPSQNLVNAFKTKDGLPMFDDYNDSNYDSSSDSSDPRLFHTVAMPELPYKYNEALIYKENWNRNIPYYGVYASLKENVDPSCDCFVNMSPFYGNTKNRIIIRYADAILMRAEALIELKRQDEALALINQIRERAQRSTTLTSYAPNQNVSLYQPGVNCTWTQDYARQALRWERRLEFAMEGSRFFDLVRWGIADDVINTYYKEESARRSYLASGNFTKNKNEYVPIPEKQISYVNGIYKQNPGY